MKSNANLISDLTNEFKNQTEFNYFSNFLIDKYEKALNQAELEYQQATVYFQKNKRHEQAWKELKEYQIHLKSLGFKEIIDILDKASKI